MRRIIQYVSKISGNLAWTKGKAIPHPLTLRVRMTFPYLPTYMKRAIFNNVCQEGLGSVHDFSMDMNLVDGRLDS